MSRDWSTRTPRGVAITRLLAIVVAIAALLAAGVSQPSRVIAQDATPAAGECDAPALPPGEATPPEEMGSPEAMEGTDMGAASPEAEPAEDAAPVGTPADEATTAEAQAAAANLANCANAGNDEGTVALFTENFLTSFFGTSNPYDVIAGGFLEGTMFGDFQTGAVATYDDGRVGVEVTYMQTQYQFVAEEWLLMQDGDYWKLDEFVPMTPEPDGDTAVVGVALGSADNEYSIVPNASSVVQPEVLLFQATNGGVEDHQLVVVKLPEGVTIDQVMADPSLEEQVEFIGVVDGIGPGETQGLALVGLPAGEYTLVCFYPSPDGAPHVALGMVATFTVAPAA